MKVTIMTNGYEEENAKPYAVIYHKCFLDRAKGLKEIQENWMLFDGVLYLFRNADCILSTICKWSHHAVAGVSVCNGVALLNVLRIDEWNHGETATLDITPYLYFDMGYNDDGGFVVHLSPESIDYEKLLGGGYHDAR